MKNLYSCYVIKYVRLDSFGCTPKVSDRLYNKEEANYFCEKANVDFSEAVHWVEPVTKQYINKRKENILSVVTSR